MPRDEPVVFFVDASLGRRIVPEALRQAGFEVVAHDDRFQPGTPDEVWLSEAGHQGWVVLTKDKRIRYRAVEQQALRRANVATFVLIGKDLTGPEMADVLCAALPRILRTLRTQHRPFIATVGAGGRVTLLG